MMCHEAKRQLDLFMDGELSVADNMKVLEHLNLCRPCAGVYEGDVSPKKAKTEWRVVLSATSEAARAIATYSKPRGTRLIRRCLGRRAV